MPKQTMKDSIKSEGSESPRSQRPRKYTKTERSHAENQERAYIAASRRSDRSLEARLESARRASEIHKTRTGKGFRITEKAVMNEEMYEEEDPNYDRIVNSLVHSYNMPSIQTQFGGPMPLQRGGSISHISPMSPQMPQFSPSTPMFQQPHQGHRSSISDHDANTQNILADMMQKQRQFMEQSWRQRMQQQQQGGNTVHPGQLDQMMGFGNNQMYSGSQMGQYNQVPMQLSLNTTQTQPLFYQQVQSPATFHNSPLASPHPQGHNSTPSTPMQHHHQSQFQQPQRSPHLLSPSHYQQRHSTSTASYLEHPTSVAASPLAASTPATDAHQPPTPQPLATPQPLDNDQYTDSKVVSGVSMLKQPYVRPDEQSLEATVAEMPTADMLFEDCIDFNFGGSVDGFMSGSQSQAYKQALGDMGTAQWEMDNSELFGGVNTNNGSWQHDGQGYGDL